uniref:Uncharacterized protein n=1 Tax=Arundo donax TaxID=35708 RepID=A0A0A9FKY4_ARUDO
MSCRSGMRCNIINGRAQIDIWIRIEA